MFPLFYYFVLVLSSLKLLQIVSSLLQHLPLSQEQLILTSPRSLTSVVLGKYVAALIIILITEALTFIYYFGMLYTSRNKLFLHILPADPYH